ncbi:hypothetical protein U1Q18_017596 [Sarracenia purpurea var. burkii]
MKVRRAEATKTDQDLLSLCQVGICKNYGNIVDLEKSMVEANIPIPTIKKPGGSKVLLMFRSMVEKESFVWSNMACNNGPFENSSSPGILKEKNVEALASSSHVAESNLAPQKLSYKEALQGSAEKTKMDYTKVVSTKDKEVGPTKGPSPNEDILFSKGSTIGVPPKMQY